MVPTELEVPQDPLAGTHILLGVTGSIAAYKTPELVRLLSQAGAEVRVILTEGGASFVTPLTLQAVSGASIHRELLDPAEESGMDHIRLARWADVLLIAPASADALARIAQGRADDLLGTCLLATTAKVAVVPAMNHQMWNHPATQRNATQVERDGATLIGPETGSQACREEGPGRMVEPPELVEQLRYLLTPKRLARRGVVITAGPTREPLDPVRFISNRSSGKMGFALAAAAQGLGAKTTLVAGPTTLQPPPGVFYTRVDTATEMAEAVHEAVVGADLFISCAAVADYRPAREAADKGKAKEPWTLELIPNPDILAEVAALSNAPRTLGFAVEIGEVLPRARNKRTDKGIDWLAVNDINEPGCGFETETNRLTLLGSEDELTFPFAPKANLAQALLGYLASQL